MIVKRRRRRLCCRFGYCHRRVQFPARGFLLVVIIGLKRTVVQPEASDRRKDGQTDRSTAELLLPWGGGHTQPAASNVQCRGLACTYVGDHRQVEHAGDACLMNARLLIGRDHGELGERTSPGARCRR